MKFLLDECCSARLVHHLRNDGHDALYVMEESPGATDAEVLEKAYREERILITEDKDFGRLVYRLQKNVVGIILLRFTSQQRRLQWMRLKELIASESTVITGKFVVIDTEKFRIRPLN